MNQSAFQEAKDFQPQVVIIMLGTNDAKDVNYRNIGSFTSDYSELIDFYNSLPNDQQIYLVKPPPIYSNNLGLDDSNLEEGVIPKIEQVADDKDLPTIDVNSVMAYHSEYFKDGVHPNTDGAEVIAYTINDALTRYVKTFKIPLDPNTLTTIKSVVKHADSDVEPKKGVIFRA